MGWEILLTICYFLCFLWLLSGAFTQDTTQKAPLPVRAGEPLVVYGFFLGFYTSSHCVRSRFTAFVTAVALSSPLSPHSKHTYLS